MPALSGRIALRDVLLWETTGYLIEKNVSLAELVSKRVHSKKRGEFIMKSQIHVFPQPKWINTISCDEKGRKDFIDHESVRTGGQRIGLKDCSWILAPIQGIYQGPHQSKVSPNFTPFFSS